MHGFGVMSQCCVSVCNDQISVVLSLIFREGARIIKRGPKLKMFMRVLGLPFSIRQYHEKRKLRCRKRREYGGPETEKGHSLLATCRHTSFFSIGFANFYIITSGGHPPSSRAARRRWEHKPFSLFASLLWPPQAQEPHCMYMPSISLNAKPNSQTAPQFSSSGTLLRQWCRHHTAHGHKMRAQHRQANSGFVLFQLEAVDLLLSLQGFLLEFLDGAARVLCWVGRLLETALGPVQPLAWRRHLLRLVPPRSSWLGAGTPLSTARSPMSPKLSHSRCACTSYTSTEAFGAAVCFSHATSVASGGALEPEAFQSSPASRPCGLTPSLTRIASSRSPAIEKDM